MKIKQITFWVLILAISCASPGTPSGGAKDEDPPKITSVKPQNYSVSFDKKQIVIDFNEFVKLNNASQNVLISPPQKKKPKVSLRERRIVVDLRDSLYPNTTYVIDFGNAIEDNNEGNSLGEYRYVFSTGAKIDEMGLAGYVKGAQVDTVATSAKVALYNLSDTLNPYNLLPEYIAQTDSLGFFMFTNIKDKAYEIIAFQDENSNNILDEGEQLAFESTPVHTSESLGNSEDSLQFDKYTKFKNINLQLRMFQSIASQQYLTEYARPLPEEITFTFNAPRTDSLEVAFLNGDENPNFIIEKSAQNDSLTYWILNENLMQKDTLLAQVSYLRTDSLAQLSSFSDTLELVYKKKKKKKNKKNEKQDDKNKDLPIQTTMKGKINAFDALTLSFERPIKGLKKESILLYTREDSLQTDKEFSLKLDSLFPHRKAQLLTDLKEGQTYYLCIDSAQIFDTGGRTNKQLETSFTTYRADHYGKLFVTVTGGTDDLQLELYDKKEPEKSVAKQKWSKNKQFVFDKLAPATYVLKALWDCNGNGKWDTGDYKKQVQPERVQTFNKEIELPSNWELEVEWELKKEKDEKSKD